MGKGQGLKSQARKALKGIVRSLSGIILPMTLSGAGRNRILATWQVPSDRSPFDRLIFPVIFDHWIRTVYLVEPNPDKRESLKDLCMSGKSGVAWANEYDQCAIDRSLKYFELTFDEANPHFSAIEDILKDAPNRLVIQVGCSSGREMAYLASRFPQAEFCGTDIDKDIVYRASLVHKFVNLTFKVMRAHEIPEQLSTARPVTIFSSGSLQYVQPEHLARMFSGLAQLRDVEIVLLEPWSASGSPCFQHYLSRWRGNFSYSHDYELFAKKCGFETQRKDLIRFTRDASSSHFGTRHYFYLGHKRG